ncbi:MAG TPA: hypothetical protein VG205_08680, partial [Acidimicrobiales bacterium]|nr:hypothetical protein [Acidimicrobiales bacterium]
MAATDATVLDVASMADLLRGARDGSAEVLGALAERPLLVVDLDTPGELEADGAPVMLPCVIVGISRSGAGAATATAGPLEGVDLALTRATHPDAPWVSVADLDR